MIIYNILLSVGCFSFQAKYFKNVILILQIDGSEQDGNVEGSIGSVDIKVRKFIIYLCII